MDLIANGLIFTFEPYNISISKNNITNVFSRKINKTLYETITEIKSSGKKNRYVKFKPKAMSSYADYKNYTLGEFLSILKSNGDSFYKAFLNKYGDGNFCSFALTDNSILASKGLYCYCVDNKLMYIGRCLDCFKNRINQGYGKIHPKNCYIDGQTTNCHLNGLINSVSNKVSIYICPLNDNETIKKIEMILIGKYSPPWNIALRTR